MIPRILVLFFGGEGVAGLPVDALGDEVFAVGKVLQMLVGIAGGIGNEAARAEVVRVVEVLLLGGGDGFHAIKL